jgi:hypothetical protein
MLKNDICHNKDGNEHMARLLCIYIFEALISSDINRQKNRITLCMFFGINKLDYVFI